MSEENVEIVRQLLEAEARRDPATALRLYDPEIEFDTSRGTFGDVAGSRVVRGLDELRAWFLDWYEAWENVEESIEELVDSGDSVISIVTLRGRGRHSGIELELTRQPAVWTIRDGKVVRVQWFRTRAEAIEAAGLSE